jgi:uncharacterized protein (TIGR03790 family)
MSARFAGEGGGSRWPVRVALAVLVLCAAFAQRALALSPDEIALVVNAQVPESRALAEFYAEQRHIPPGRIIEISIPAAHPDYPSEHLDAVDYEPKIAIPIRTFLKQHNLQDKVKCLVTFWGVPLYIGNRRTTREELGELKPLQDELSKKVQPQIARDVASAEALAKAVQPDFKPGVGSDLPSLVRRVQTAVNVIANAIPKLPDPAQQRAKHDQFMPILDDLLGTGQSALQTANSPLAALSSEPVTTEQLAQYRDKLLAAQQQVAVLGQVRDAANRAAIRKLVRENFGIITYAQLLNEQQVWVNNAQSDAALDSELSLLWWNDAYPKYRWVQNFLNFRVGPDAHPPGPPLMVMRLDGPTDQIVHDIITTSIAVEKTGLQGQVALDARGMPEDNSYGGYDQTIRNLAGILKKTKLQVTLDNTPALFPDHSQFHVALYCGWYSVGHYHPCCQFEPGAVGFHVASFEMTSLHDRGNTGWCRGLLLDGIDATLGPVNEPYLQSFPRADEFFPLLLTGKLTLAEVYWKTTPMASWMQCCVGDPLYNPYKVNAPLKVADLPADLQAIFKTAPAPVPPAVTGPALPEPGSDHPGI